MDIDPDRHVGQGCQGSGSGSLSWCRFKGRLASGAEEAGPEDAKAMKAQLRNLKPSSHYIAILWRTRKKYRPGARCQPRSETSSLPQRQAPPPTDVWLSLAVPDQAGDWPLPIFVDLPAQVMAELAVNAMLRLKGKWARSPALGWGFRCLGLMSKTKAAADPMKANHDAGVRP